MRWRRSTYSAANGDCVELATAGATVYVRDSKAPDAGAWRELLGVGRPRHRAQRQGLSHAPHQGCPPPS